MPITSGIIPTVYGNTVSLLKGATSSSIFTTYLGVPGEVVVDMGPVANTAPFNWSIRVLNGVIPGGTLLATNLSVATLNTSLNSTISSVNSLTGNVLVLQANAVTQAVQIVNLSNQINFKRKTSVSMTDERGITNVGP